VYDGTSGKYCQKKLTEPIIPEKNKTGGIVGDPLIPPLPPSPPTPPLFNNLHEYFQPVFDEVDKLNKMLDSHIEEENANRGKEKKK
jgi:hypothetical protein